MTPFQGLKLTMTAALEIYPVLYRSKPLLSVVLINRVIQLQINQD
jgi:hypothetical protein